MTRIIREVSSKIGYMNIPAPYADEMISGYLCRMMRDNVCSGTSLGDFMIASGVWERPEVMKADGLSKGMFDIVDIRGIEPVMQMTTLPALIPLMSRGQASRYIRSTCSLRHGNTVLSSRPASVVDLPRHCPVCDAQATYVRTWHCIPGVTVCAEHGIPLVEQMVNPAGEVIEHEMVPQPMALEYARFVKALSEAEPKFFMQETLPALRNRIATYEKETGRRFLTHLESLGLGRAAAGIAYVMKYIETCDNELPFEEVLTALMVLYGTAEAFINDVTVESSRERFMQAIKGRFEMTSGYDERIVRLRCLDCGYEFPTTPHAILTGWGCPVEDAELTEQELFMNLFTATSDGYELIGEFKDFQRTIRVRHVGTDRVADVKPDRFINFPHAGMMGKEPLPFEAVRKEVEQDGNYVLNAVSRNTEILVDVTHKTCGERYVLSLRKFRRRTGCRCCDAIVADGALRGVGMDISGLGVADGRKDRREDTERLRSVIAAFGDEPFFLEDITFTDKRFIANTVSRMAREGEIRKLGSGVYCSASATPAFMDIVDAKFVVRHGERRGFHCGRTLLQDLGLSIDDPVPTVVTMTPDKAFNTDIYNLCGRKVRVIKSHIPVTEDNWRVLAVLFMLRHETLDQQEKEALSKWMGYMNIGFADLVRYRDGFTARVFADAVALLRRAA
jgi:hypothetical protein